MGRAVVMPMQRAGTPYRQQRTIFEHLIFNVPGLYRVLAFLAMELMPRCRLRRGLVRWQLMAGWSSLTRRDYQLTMVRYHRDLRYEVDDRFQALGLPAKIHGQQALVAALSEWAEEWDRWELAPMAMVELDDRLLGLGKFIACGRASGVEVDLEYAQLITFRAGMAVHEHDFVDWDQALVAADLELDDLATILRVADAALGSSRARLASPA